VDLGRLHPGGRCDRRPAGHLRQPAGTGRHGGDRPGGQRTRGRGPGGQRPPVHPSGARRGGGPARHPVRPERVDLRGARSRVRRSHRRGRPRERHPRCPGHRRLAARRGRLPGWASGAPHPDGPCRPGAACRIGLAHAPHCSIDAAAARARDAVHAGHHGCAWHPGPAFTRVPTWCAGPHRAGAGGPGLGGGRRGCSRVNLSPVLAVSPGVVRSGAGGRALGSRFAEAGGPPLGPCHPGARTRAGGPDPPGRAQPGRPRCRAVVGRTPSARDRPHPDRARPGAGSDSDAAHRAPDAAGPPAWPRTPRAA
ncbi:Hypothetical protein KLENKIAIHU_2729, partial [Klenkia terrae]